MNLPGRREGRNERATKREAIGILLDFRAELVVRRNASGNIELLLAACAHIQNWTGRVTKHTGDRTPRSMVAVRPMIPDPQNNEIRAFRLRSR